MRTQIFPFHQLAALNRMIPTTTPLPPNRLCPECSEQFTLFSPPADVVMIGDSITNAGNWSEIFPTVRIANRGIRGDRSDDIARRMNTILSVRPKRAFLMMGINDIGWGRSTDDIMRDYAGIVRALRTARIKVFIQSTIECRRSLCGSKLASVRELNARLKSYAATNAIPYIDINRGLTDADEGLLPPYTSDGVHLRGNAYATWSRIIAPYVLPVG